MRRRDHHGVRRKRNKMQEDGGKIGGRMEGKRRSLEGTEWKEQQKGGKDRASLVIGKKEVTQSKKIETRGT